MSSLVPPLAFGFGNLAMLGWLAVAAAPLLIHLYNRHRHREAPWAAMEFILAALRKHSRRLRLHQWLLLAVRTALILLVVIALAEPYTSELGLTFAPGKPTHRVFVIDTSFSMDALVDQQSRLDVAKRLIADLVADTVQGDGFTLVRMSDPPTAIVRSPAFSRQDFLAELQAVEITHGGADLAAALAVTERLIADARRLEPRLERQEVYIVSDLGKTTWLSGTERDEARQIEERARAIAADAEIIVLDVGRDSPTNLAVERFACREPLVVNGRDASFEIGVRNFSAEPVENCEVSLLIDDTVVARRQVDIPPQAAVTVPFVHRFTDSGMQSLVARIGPDAVSIDNRRWLSLRVKDHASVLCVEGRRGDASYVAHALNPDGTPESLFLPRVVPESGLLELPLSAYDCVFLCNIAQFTVTEARLLRDYLSRGGGLVFVLGDQVVPDYYNRLLSEAEFVANPVGQPSSADAEEAVEDRGRLLPARIESRVPRGDYRFEIPENWHPIVADFRGANAGLLSTPIYEYFRLEPLDEAPRAEVALSFEGGDPAIMIEPLGGGQVVLIATAVSLPTRLEASLPMNAWAAWPSFLPMIREVVFAAVGRQNDQFNFQVGDSLFTALPIEGEPIVRITLPSGGEHVVRRQPQSEPRGWSYLADTESGLYAVRQGEADPAIPLAVNVDTAESELARVAPAEVPPPMKVRTSIPQADRPGDPQTAQRQHLHRGLLLAAVALAVGELILAWHLGRGV